MSSPNVLYYSVLKGIVKFTPTGGVQRDLGNAPEIELTPGTEKLDHFSSRAGVRSKDRSVLLEKTLTLRIVIDEFDPENVRMALLGSTVADNTSGNASFRIFAESEITGAIYIEGTNTIGSQVRLQLPSVSFTPSGSINFISEEWAQMELTAEVLYNEDLGDFGECEIILPSGVSGSA